MKKIKLNLILFILLLMPLTAYAQFDFNIGDFNFGDLLNEATDDSNINLNSLKLSWTAETYTPYEYKGRALPTQGSNVIIDAILDISGENPSNLKYSWFLDDIFQENKSGYGRNSFQFGVRRAGGSSHKVLIKIFNDSRSFMVEKSIDIPIVGPEIALYFSNGGSYSSDRVIDSVDVYSDKKSIFIIRPYFFDINKLTDLSFEWRLANQQPIISSAYSANALDLFIGGKTSKEILKENLLVKVTNKLDSRQTQFQSVLVKIH